MTGFLIALVAGGAGTYLCWRHILTPMGRVLELCDELVEIEGRFVTPGAGPQVRVARPAARLDSFVREVALARSPPRG